MVTLFFRNSQRKKCHYPLSPRRYSWKIFNIQPKIHSFFNINLMKKRNRICAAFERANMDSSNNHSDDINLCNNKILSLQIVKIDIVTKNFGIRRRGTTHAQRFWRDGCSKIDSIYANSRSTNCTENEIGSLYQFSVSLVTKWI